MRKNHKSDQQSGMALVLTLMAVSFLVAITVQLTTSVNWQMQGAGNLRDSVQLDAVNRSGLSLVRAALLADFKENKTYDSEHDSWNTLDVANLFGQGALQVKVVDLSGLLQVNALVPDVKKKEEFQNQQQAQVKLWKRLLNSGKFKIDDPGKIDELIESIIDWIDENDDPLDKGAESGYYLSRSPPYKPRNAPLTYPEELLLIRGMTKELFYGNDEYSPLASVITVAGRDGTVNINSAPQDLLMALDPEGGMTAEHATDMIEFRREEDNKDKLSQLGWYKQIVSVDLETEKLAVVKSQYFEITVEATYKSMTRSGTGIISRDSKKGEQSLLYWEVR